jgi:hypothetical protein
MKKVTTFVGIMLFVTSLCIPAGQPTGNYQKIEQFMADYYAAYNQYAQDAATIDLMDEYWAPEFLSVQYLPIPGYPLVMNRTTWKNLLVSAHLNMLEILNPEEISIDTHKLTVVTRAIIDFKDRSSGDLILELSCIGFYNLKIDRNHKLKMTCLKLYFADPYALMAISPAPPGM